MNTETEFPMQEQELMDIWHAEQNYWKNDRNVELKISITYGWRSAIMLKTDELFVFIVFSMDFSDRQVAVK